MKILICAVAQPLVGTGHVRRMLTLTQALLEQSNTVAVTLITSELGADIAKLLCHDRFDVLIQDCTPAAVKAHLEANRYERVILDNYHWHDQLEAPLQELTHGLCVVDDLADRHHAVDFLLDQNAYHRPRDYHGLVPDGCTLMVGADYCMLPPQFRSTKIRNTRIRLNKPDTPVFVSLGGGDPLQSLVKITRTLLTQTDFNLTIATGSHIPDAATLTQLATEHADRVELIFDSTVVAEQMAKSRFAIASGGTMTWERAAIGLPSLCLILADNQVKSANWLAERNVHTTFDIRGDWHPDALAAAALALSRNEAALKQYTEASLELGLADGVVRVAQTLLNTPDLEQK